MIRRVIEVLKECLFPVFCISCEKEGEWWCNECRKKEKNLPFNVMAGGNLNKVTAFFNYRKNDSVSKLIYNLKYGFAYDQKTLWKEVIVKAPITFRNNSHIVPVPLYKTRKRLRGFNQSELLANILSKTHNIPVINKSLIRVRPTVQQAKLLKEDRVLNVANAFAWKGEKCPENIILVDDIFTTGATMQECAKVLRENGAKWVEGIVLAHG